MARVTDSLVIELRATFEKLAGDMNSAARTLSKFESKFANIGSALGGALGVGLGLAIGSKIKNLAALGDELSDLENNYRNLGGAVGGIQAAEAATAGMVSKVNLLKAANMGLQKGIPGLSENFALVAEVATKTAEAIGGDAASSVKELVNAISKGSPEILAKFGIIVQKGASVEEIFKKMAESAATLGPLGSDVASAFNQASAAFDNLLGIMGKVVNESSTLYEFTTAITNGLNYLGLIVDSTFSVSSIAKITNTKNEMAELASQIDNFTFQPLQGFFDSFEARDKQIAKLKTRYVELQNSLGGLIAAYKSEHEVQNKAAKEAREHEFALKKQAAAMKEAADKAAALKKEYEGWVSTNVTNQITQALKESIDNLDEADFQKYSQMLYNVTAKTVDQQLAPYLEAHLMTEQEAAVWKEILIGDVIHPVTEEWQNKNSETAKKFRDEMLKNVKDFLGGIETIGSSVENIFGIKLPDSLHRALDIVQEIVNTIEAVGKIADAISGIAALLSGNPAGAGSIPGVGDVVNKVVDKVGSVVNKIGGAFGFAQGGVVNSPQFFTAGGKLSVMGETGPEAIMPLTRQGGKLGVRVMGGTSSGANLYIDARGAAPGVEYMIERAIERAAPGIVQGSVDAVMRSFQTGHSIRNDF